MLSDGDVITFGGEGVNVRVGSSLKQSNAEFVFRVSIDQSSSGREEKDQYTAEERPAGEIDATLVLPLGSANDDRTQAMATLAVGGTVGDATMATYCEGTLILPLHDDDDDDGKDDNEADSSSSSNRVRTSSSSAMVDASFIPSTTQIIITAPSNAGRRNGGAAGDAAAALSGRSSSHVAPTLVLPSDSGSGDGESQMMVDISEAEQATAQAATVRIAPGADATAAAALPDVPVSPTVQPMSLDASLQPPSQSAANVDSQAPTQVLDDAAADPPPPASSKGAATAATAAHLNAPPTLSTSFLNQLGGMAVITQTQTITDPDAAEASSHGAAALPTTNDAHKLYDHDGNDDGDEEIDLTGTRSTVHTPSSTPADPRYVSARKKRVRSTATAERNDDDANGGVEEKHNDDDDSSTPNKRSRLSGPPSSHPIDGPAAAASSPHSHSPAAAAAATHTSPSPSPSPLSSSFSCPICHQLIPSLTLAAHVDACLRAAAERENEAAARALQEKENEKEGQGKDKGDIVAASTFSAAALLSPSPASSAAVVPLISSSLNKRKGGTELGGKDKSNGRRRGKSSDGADVDGECEDEDDDAAAEAFWETYDDSDVDCSPEPASHEGSFEAFGSRKGAPVLIPRSIPVLPGAAVAAAAASPSFCAAATSVPAAAAAASSSPRPSESHAPCPLCSKSFPTSQLAAHASSCEGPDETCDNCSRSFAPSRMATHKDECSGPMRECIICEEFFPLDQIDRHMQTCCGKGSKPCSICKIHFAPEELDKHEEMCLAIEAQHSQDEKFAMECQRAEQPSHLCNAMQLRAIQWVAERAKELSVAAEKPLLQRFKKLGYDARAFKDTIRYIRNKAPIIIHVNLQTTMQYFIKDTHYRNQFETKTSCGTLSSSARTSWEDSLFNRIYHSASGFERVKYGVLNIVNDPQGVLSCRGYGDSYLWLKNETVRLRTSFANRDTGGGMAKLASTEWYCHVLLEYSDAELEDVIQVATGKKYCVSSSRISNYKEVQFHGPIEFSRDVEALVVAPRHKGDARMAEMIEQFATKNHINVIWQEEEDRSADRGPYAGYGMMIAPRAPARAPRRAYRRRR